MDLKEQVIKLFGKTRFNYWPMFPELFYGIPKVGQRWKHSFNSTVYVRVDDERGRAACLSAPDDSFFSEVDGDIYWTDNVCLKDIILLD